MVPSIKPKFDNVLLIYVHCKHKIASVFIWFAELIEQFQVRNLYKTHKSTMKWSIGILAKLNKLWICLIFF